MTRESLFPSLRHEVDRIFDTLVHGAWGSPPERAAWRPAVDLFEEADRYRVEVDLPGVRASDLSITAEGATLRVEGVRPPSGSGAQSRCHVAERPCGRFARTFRLPEDADRAGIRVRLQEGVLTVEVPRTQGRAR